MVAGTGAGDRGRSTGEVGGSQNDGDRPGTIIAAFVRARVLGLQILTLEARVALVPAGVLSELPAAVARAKALPPSASELTKEGAKRPSDLAYAVHLLEESSKSLDEVRGRRNFLS